jgi:hypothetical protein
MAMISVSACAPKSGEVPAPPASPRTELLVKELPAGVEGLELRDGAIWLKEGYTFEPQPDGTFIIGLRDGSGGGGTGGGCGCKSGGGKCEPVLEGGIAVCKGDSACTKCGLALTVGGVTTEVMLFTR